MTKITARKKDGKKEEEKKEKERERETKEKVIRLPTFTLCLQKHTQLLFPPFPPHPRSTPNRNKINTATNQVNSKGDFLKITTHRFTIETLAVVKLIQLLQWSLSQAQLAGDEGVDRQIHRVL